METNNQGSESGKARLDQLDRHVDQLDERAGHMPADAAAHLRSRLDAIRARLAAIRAHLREKDDADTSSDAALREVGHAINDMYEELADRPK